MADSDKDNAKAVPEARAFLRKLDSEARAINRVMHPLPPQVYRDAMGYCEFAFVHTRNGLFMWRAYQYARMGGLPVPESVLRYLDTCARAVEAGGTDTALTTAMLLRQYSRKGGAGASSRARTAERQANRLAALYAEYQKVRAGTVKDKTTARENAAARLGTTPGALRQLERKLTPHGPL